MNSFCPSFLLLRCDYDLRFHRFRGQAAFSPKSNPHPPKNPNPSLSKSDTLCDLKMSWQFFFVRLWDLHHEAEPKCLTCYPWTSRAHGPHACPNKLKPKPVRKGRQVVPLGPWLQRFFSFRNRPAVGGLGLSLSKVRTPPKWHPTLVGQNEVP